MNLFYPEIKVQLGKYVFYEGISLQVSVSLAAYGWATVTLTKEYEDHLQIIVGDPVKISVGYEDQMAVIFSGIVTGVPGGKTGLHIYRCSDQFVVLSAVNVSEVFLDVQAAEIVKSLCMRAGLNSYDLSAAATSKKTRFAVSRSSGCEVLKRVNASWNLSYQYFFSWDTFYWGTVPKQEVLYEFEYAKNIIELTKDGEYWILETVAVPFIQLSNEISLKHPLLSGRYVVKKIVYESNQKGFLRMHLYL